MTNPSQPGAGDPLQELIAKWRKRARLLREGLHEDAAYLPYAIKLEMCASELESILPAHDARLTALVVGRASEIADDQHWLVHQAHPNHCNCNIAVRDTIRALSSLDPAEVEREIRLNEVEGLYAMYRVSNAVEPQKRREEILLAFRSRIAELSKPKEG